jgi:hypothetical protein
MRLFWLLLILALAAAAFYRFQPETFRQLQQQIPAIGPDTKTNRLYQWRNERGEWQITDTPPPAGVPYSQQDYRSDVNVLPAPPGTAPAP